MAQFYTLQICFAMLIYANFYTITLAVNGPAFNASCATATQGTPVNRGKPGFQGGVGKIGPNGEKGSKGDTGIIGIPCAIGHEGSVGKKGEDGQPGTNGIMGKRGPKGKIGNTGIVGQQGLVGEKGPRGERGERSVKSAFTVAFINNPQRAAYNKPLKYDHVITDIGNNYNFSNGKFICQHVGTYFFQVTTMKDSSQNPASVFIVKNSKSVVMAYTSAGDHNSATAMVVLNLASGDEVWTRTYNNYFYSNSNAYFTFSGFLMYTV